MEELREDPELKPMFDDIAATGSAGMDRYWNDADLMSRISHKMQQMGIQPPQPPPQPSAPSKSLPVRPAPLHPTPCTHALTHTRRHAQPPARPPS